MKPLILLFLLLSITSPKVYACPDEIARTPGKYKASPYEVKLLMSIYRHENSQHKGYCQAVLSPKYKGCQRQVKRCLEIIREEWRRWDSRGRQGRFIKTLGLRYCNPKYDFQGHKNWVRSVGKMMRRAERHKNS